MRRAAVFIEGGLLVLLVLCVNAAAVGQIVLHGRTDASFVESAYGGEDELRYLAKIREASEGRWLMANPYLKEHREEGFSPSGFVEWIPAAMLRTAGGNWGAVLLLTDLLFTALTILLTRLWLGRLIVDRRLAWACMFLLFATAFGGSLSGLLRDTVPKFIQPLPSLYLLLLCLPSRGTLKMTLLRGGLIGCMYYTYPYHWTLCLVTEGLLFLQLSLARLSTLAGSSSPRALVAALRRRAVLTPLLRYAAPRAAAGVIPLAVLAAPIAFAMWRMLSRPEFADFYDRYHIVYTHIPAAPRLQAVIVLALCAAALTAWYLRRKHRSPAVLLPLALPLLAMLLLLNSNVLSGKDPEWLGHGGRVIMPVVTATYAVILSLLLPRRIMQPAGIVLLLLSIGVMGWHATARYRLLDASYAAWDGSDEREVLAWLERSLPPERIVAAPRTLSELLPVQTSHYTFFAAGAHFFFVPSDELTDRYLGWVGLYPWEKELTDTATVIIFGNHPGAQWSKERTVSRLLGRPFSKTMADYITRQDLRRQIDAEHASPVPALTRQRLARYGTDVIVTKDGVPQPDLLDGFVKQTDIGAYGIWTASGAGLL